MKYYEDYDENYDENYDNEYYGEEYCDDESCDEGHGDGYDTDEEMYVYDQCCENCRYYCGWGEKSQRGCKFYARDDYERFPKSHWCYQWKGIKKSRSGRYGRYDDSYDERHGERHGDR